MKISRIAAAAGLFVATLGIGTAADARPHDGPRWHDSRGYDRDYRDGRYDRGYRDYDRRGDYRRYNYNRRCSNGTTGTVVGAIAGGLLGRTIDSRGDRTLGTVLGAGAGALAGRAVERSDRPGYCR